MADPINPRPNPTPGGTGTRKLLGELLMEEGYLQSEDLRRLVQVQKSMTKAERKPIGRLAVEMGYLTEEQLRRVLDLHGKRLALGELLVSKGLINQESLAAALSLQDEEGGLLGEILVDLGIINEVALAETLADQADLAYVPLAQADPLEPDLARWVNPNYAVKNGLVPIGRLGRRLTVAIWHPASVSAADDLAVATGCRVQLVLSTRSQVRERMMSLYGLSLESSSSMPQQLERRLRVAADAGPGKSQLAELGLDGPEAESLQELFRSGDGVFLVVGPAGPRLEEFYHRVWREAQETLGRPEGETAPSGDSSERTTEGAGEIRDWRSVEKLFRVMTGSQFRIGYLAADHTTAAVSRLLDLGLQPEKLAPHLLGVLAIIPLGRNCAECTQAYDPHLLVLSEWFGNSGSPPDVQWKRGRGCATCRNTGFQGETVAAELWLPTEEEREAGRAGVAPRRLREQVLSRIDGLGLRALGLAARGETTLEELLRRIPAEVVRGVRAVFAGQGRKAA